MQKLRLGIIGFGKRGQGILHCLLQNMDDIIVTAVCDLYQDRVDWAIAKTEELAGNVPFGTTDYHVLLARDDVDAVLTPSAWEAHIDVCVDAMKAGKPVGCEVGGAYSVDDCWRLVRTFEETQTPCMLMENCCYGQEEMAVLNMIKKGLFGEIVHLEGGYRHDLRCEVAEGHIARHYRLDNYKHRNGELYPTHELGPIAKDININRGNRMLTLCSMASKSAGINEWIRTRHPGENFENENEPFCEGDVVTTLIKCANGETITLQHDTSLPRPYSRANLVQGTKGMWSEDKHGVYFDGVAMEYDFGETFTDISKFYDKYQHPLWNGYEAVGGHGGMDYLVLRAFIEAVRDKKPMPIDVYDMAAWMVITPLSEESIAMGSMPVSIPDFTNGKWTHREPFYRSRYCLEDVCTECFEEHEGGAEQ